MTHTTACQRAALEKKEDTGRRSRSYRTLQDHGHSLFLLHHVEVLAKVRCHVPLPQVFRIILIHPVEVPLFVRGCGRGWWGHHCSLSVTIHCRIFLGSYRIKMKGSIVSESMCNSISNEHTSLTNTSAAEDLRLPDHRSHDVGGFFVALAYQPSSPCTSQWHFSSLLLFFSRQQNNLTKLLCLLTTWRTR